MPGHTFEQSREQAAAGARSATSRRNLVVAILLAIIVAANAAFMVWLWLKNGGITQASGDGAVATSIGRITGLLGAYLALLQVLLIARLPHSKG